jgi:hypothetical protein
VTFAVMLTSMLPDTPAMMASSRFRMFYREAGAVITARLFRRR